MRSGILREDLRAFLVGQSNGPGDVEQGVFFSHYYRELQNFAFEDIFVLFMIRHNEIKVKWIFRGKSTPLFGNIATSYF